MSQLEPNETRPPLAVPPVLVVSGLSGAGKSTVIGVLEDMHFLTVDGLPTGLAPQISNLFTSNAPPHYRGLALGIDLRDDPHANGLNAMLDSLYDSGASAVLLFLEADEDVLLRRYASTRRPHPLENEGLGLEQAVREEKKRLKAVRERADLVVDTSSFSIHDLRRLIQKRWSTLRGNVSSLRVNLVSFGFKYGAPADADMMFDLRFLPNPYFEPELQAMSGLDKPVADFVLGEQGQAFFAKLTDFLLFILPQYESEGRYRLTIGLGCTGGRHRSAAMAEALAAALRQSDYPVSVEHRHLELG